MKNMRYQLPKILALAGLLVILWWTYYSFIAGPVNKVLVQRDKAIAGLLKVSAFTDCIFINDSQLDETAYIIECLSMNSERLIVAIDENGRILSRFRLEQSEEDVQNTEIKLRYPEVTQIQWVYYANDILYRLITDNQEIYLKRNDLNIVMKVGLAHE